MEDQISFLEVILKKHQRKSETWRVLEVKEEPAVNKGENYTSLMTRAKLKVVLGSGKIVEKFFIIKRPHDSNEVLEFLERFDIYKNEIHVYSQIIPAIEALMSSQNDNSNKLWCDFFGSENDSLVLQDLKAEGFRMTERRTGMDLKHGLLTLKSLGRFHALSLVLQRRQILDLQLMSPCVYTRNTTVLNEYFKGFLDCLFRAMRSHWGQQWSDVASRLETFFSDFGEKLSSLGKADSPLLKVLNHGDCWTNNILFKYSSNSDNPEELRFVDFQGANYGSFAWDVINFLHSSLLPEFRRKNYKTFMSEYMKSLHTTMTAYDCPQNKLPSMDVLEKEMERLQFFGLLCTCTHLPATLSDPKHGLDILKLSKNETDQNIHMYLNETYRGAAEKEFSYLIENGEL